MKPILRKLSLVSLIAIATEVKSFAHESVNCKVTYILNSGEKDQRLFTGVVFDAKTEMAINEDFELMKIPAQIQVSLVDSAPHPEFTLRYQHLPSGIVFQTKSISEDRKRSTVLEISNPTFIRPEMSRLTLDCSLTQGW